MWTRVTTWQTHNPSADGRGSGRRNSSSTSYTWQYWTATLSSTLAVQNCPIGTFNSAWLGTSYRREEGCLVLTLYHRECQPFQPADWKPNMYCIGWRKGKGGGVTCVLCKRSRVRQFMHVQNATWCCVSRHVSRYIIQNPRFDTNKH
jgi:hypothetical protein